MEVLDVELLPLNGGIDLIDFDEPLTDSLVAVTVDFWYGIVKSVAVWSSPEVCISSTFMSGTFFTSSFKKSNLVSDIIHCFMCDGDKVLAFLALVIRSVLFSSDSTNNSNVLGVFQLRIKQKKSNTYKNLVTRVPESKFLCIFKCQCKQTFRAIWIVARQLSQTWMYTKILSEEL